jgi:hypothetical protein
VGVLEEYQRLERGLGLDDIPVEGLIARYDDGHEPLPIHLEDDVALLLLLEHYSGPGVPHVEDRAALLTDEGLIDAECPAAGDEDRSGLGGSQPVER